MRRKTMYVAAMALTVAVAPVVAQDARYLAGNCANCHGTDGRPASGTEGIPGLAGLSKDYFVEQMKAFRSGARSATVMHQISKGYTDEQISALGDYFSKQRK